MIKNNLSVEELLSGFKNVMDTIWIIYLEDDRVDIMRDSMTPDWEGRSLDYTKLSDTYIKDFVYPPDIGHWDETLSISAIRRLCSSGKSDRTFDMRFRNEQFGFEWHEAYLNVLRDCDGRPDRVLLTSRYVNSYRKAAIVERAVQAEYDYVVYIEANKNSYVMYTSNPDSGTPVPPVASDDYEKEVAEFHRLYVPEEERDSLTYALSISNVGPYLNGAGEYVVYCTVIENNVRRDKKMRFSYFDREKNIWILTRTDITEIRNEKRQKEQLQNALEVANVANRAKSDFLSRMSHDIRTPMNAIIGMTAIAKTHLDNQERVNDCLDKITASSKLLMSLINEVLDMSKIESGHIVLSEEEVNLAELTQGVVTMMQPQIREKGHHFEVHLISIKHEIVISDTQRLQQILLNLLSNAVKYTDDNGNIRLEITEKPCNIEGCGLYEFLVEDNGLGMKPEFIEKAFEPFERADDERIGSIQGTGLGLSICKNIAEMMGGGIRIESDYGKGSRFTVSVCLRLSENMPEYAAELKGKSVLIADDDRVVCDNACIRLSELGMKAEYTQSGLDAIKMAVEKHEAGEDYFAVIVDLKMPGMNGIETARHIRNEIGDSIPIVIVSSYDLSDYEDEVENAGINGYITKPLFKSRLAVKLSQFVKDASEKKEPVRIANKLYTGKRILVVEDNELNREIAVELIAETGALVETAENGKIAVDKFAESENGYYSLIFMDMQMPVMSGCDAAVTIRSLQREDAATVPIVAMTANAFADDRQKTAEAGMNEHMSKPIEISRILNIFERWL